MFGNLKLSYCCRSATTCQKLLQSCSSERNPPTYIPKPREYKNTRNWSQRIVLQSSVMAIWWNTYRRPRSATSQQFTICCSTTTRFKSCRTIVCKSPTHPCKYPGPGNADIHKIRSKGQTPTEYVLLCGHMANNITIPEDSEIANHILRDRSGIAQGLVWDHNRIGSTA